MLRHMLESSNNFRLSASKHGRKGGRKRSDPPEMHTCMLNDDGTCFFAARISNIIAPAELPLHVWFHNTPVLSPELLRNCIPPLANSPCMKFTCAAAGLWKVFETPESCFALDGPKIRQLHAFIHSRTRIWPIAMTFQKTISRAPPVHSSATFVCLKNTLLQ